MEMTMKQTIRLAVLSIIAAFVIGICTPTASAKILGFSKGMEKKDKVKKEKSGLSAEASGDYSGDGSGDGSSSDSGDGSQELKITPVDDPAYEWSQFDDKKGKAIMKQGMLLIESKDDKGSVASVVELDQDPAANFAFLVVLSAKPEENAEVGVVFDYKDNRNFKAILFSKKNFVYETVNGGEVSIVKQGFVKPGKEISVIQMDRNGDKVDVYLNGMDVTTLKRVDIETTNFGVVVTGKYKASVRGFYYKSLDNGDDIEQSTVD